ncbi:MAG: hypothetical protein HY721_26885 [Planctomycetes bacterium]|nr:hypothetical protein [Planctomycetota bacterium]
MGGTKRRSKQRSDSSPLPRRLESTTFLLDRSFGALKLRTALQAAGARVEVHQDHFPAKEDDDADWIRTAGQRGWIILTRDEAILHRPQERHAILSAGARIFIPDKRKGTADDWALCYVAGLQKMLSFLDRFNEPFLARVSVKPGGHTPKARVSMVKNREQLEGLQTRAGWPVPPRSELVARDSTVPPAPLDTCEPPAS